MTTEEKTTTELCVDFCGRFSEEIVKAWRAEAAKHRFACQKLTGQRYKMEMTKVHTIEALATSLEKSTKGLTEKKP